MASFKLYFVLEFSASNRIYQLEILEKYLLGSIQARLVMNHVIIICLIKECKM